MTAAMQTSVAAASTEPVDFDPARLREKYRKERDKRLKPEGTSQYKVTAGQYTHLDELRPSGFTRAAGRDIDVAVIGGGFGGLLAAARLRRGRTCAS